MAVVAGRSTRSLALIQMTIVPSDESGKDAARLTQLLAGVRTVEETLKHLGPPDRDTSTQHPPITGRDVPRILIWCGASDHWAVRVCAWADGRFNSAIEPREQWNG